MKKRVLITAALAAALTGASLAWAADDAYPSKPIRLLVGYAPGGGTDIMARLMGRGLSIELGQSVIIENKPGAGQNIAATYVARAPADGYTLFLGSPAFAINTSLYKSLDYDPVKSFAPVAMFGQSPNLLIVPNSLGVNSVAEFLAYSKKNSRRINYSSSGVGSSQHLGGEMFRQEAVIEARHIPYRGSAPSIQAIMSDEVHYTFTNIPSATPLLSSQKVRVLAITSDKRSPLLPNVPTMAEVGMPRMQMSTWYGVLAPVGTPAAVITRLNVAINKVVRNADFREQMDRQGADPSESTPASFASFLDEDIARWRSVIKAGNVSAE